MTKARTAQLLRDVEQHGAAIRFLVAGFRVMGLIDSGEQDGQPTSFVDPAWASRLDVLKRGFFGRLKWLLLGK